MARAFHWILLIVLLALPLPALAQDEEVPPLTQHHTREQDLTSFSVPETWLIREQDTFALMIAPNGVTVGISSSPYLGSDDMVLESIEGIQFSLLQSYPDIVLSDIEEVEVNSRRAARVAGIDEGKYLGYWAIDLGGEVVGYLSVNGPPADVADLELTIAAVAATITSGQVSSDYGEEETFQFTESITTNDGSLTVAYAADWVAVADEDFIVFASPGVDLEDLPRDLGKGQFVLIVQNSLTVLEEQTELDLDVSTDPATIARALAREAESNGYERTLEKLTINGRAVALVHGPIGETDSAVLIIEQADGTLGHVNARLSPGGLDELFNVLLTIGASLSPR